MKISIDRFEGKIAVGEDENGETVEIDRSKLPKGVQATHVIDVTDGVITIDEEETEKRKKRIKKLVDDLFN